MLLSIKPIDNLHSIMYLLIPDAAVFHDFKHTYLHSIMYLLIHRADEVHHGSEHHLHSIMYLLIHVASQDCNRTFNIYIP